MLDLRAYSDVLFRIDEVIQNKLDEYLIFDDRFFIIRMILIVLF
ncbi:hypothetical protein [Campylobacter pinnipediorum]|nr:hypothetical protein [Campylobacter pinnipediorum]